MTDNQRLGLEASLQQISDLTKKYIDLLNQCDELKEEVVSLKLELQAALYDREVYYKRLSDLLMEKYQWENKTIYKIEVKK